MRSNKEQQILRQSTRTGAIEVTQTPKYIYFHDYTNNTHLVFDYRGFRQFINNLIDSRVESRSPLLELNISANSKLTIPEGTAVQFIYLTGTATGITLTYNGHSHTITSCSDGYEWKPPRRYAEEELDFTVSATSWGRLEIKIIT